MAAYTRLWKQRQSLLTANARIRKRIRSIPVPRPIPTQISGFRFAFTGAIEGWIRENLYPEVRRLGGRVTENPIAVHGIDCLVLGHSTNGITKSEKYKQAKSHGVPVMDETDFLQMLERDRQR
jgi:BRCT domain type II-containing protein